MFSKRVEFNENEIKFINEYFKLFRIFNEIKISEFDFNI